MARLFAPEVYDPGGNGDKYKQTADPISNAIMYAASTNARAAQEANRISAEAQKTAMDFNEKMAYWSAGQNWAMMNSANAFQAQQAQLANDFSQTMWNNTAQFNAEQQAEAMSYNSAEAERNRQWQEQMSNTSYQRAVADLRAAGLNPVLALMKGGATVGSGATASVSPASVGSISGQQAAGKMGSTSGTSVGSFTGILENTSNELALFGAAVSGIKTAIEAWNAAKENEKNSTTIDDFFKPETNTTIHAANSIAESLKMFWENIKSDYKKNREEAIKNRHGRSR